MYAHAHTCSPKRDSWSYQTKAWESQLSSDGFEMWALPYHLPARCWEWDVTFITAYCLIRQLSLSLSLSSLSLSFSPVSGGRDEWFQLCATKTKLGTWQFQYGLFFCIKLIGCGFDGEAMWLHVSQACVCLQSDKQIAFEFMNNRKRINIISDLAACCRKWPTTDKKYWKQMFFCSYRGKQTLLCTFHYAAHTKAQQQAVIDLYVAALRAHWDSTLIDFFTINSSWLPAREAIAGVSGAALLLRSSANAGHNEHKIYKCNQLLLSDTHTHPLYNVQMHTHTQCNVDNLSNEGWQVAAAWKLSSVRLWGLHTGTLTTNVGIEVSHLNFHFFSI